MSGFFEQLPVGLRAVLEASGYGMVLAVLVVGLRMGTGRMLPARWGFVLWVLVFVRLSVIPLPASRLSLFNVFERPRAAATAAEAARVGVAAAEVSPVPAAPAGKNSAVDDALDPLAAKSPEAVGAVSQARSPAIRPVPELPARAAAGHEAGRDSFEQWVPGVLLSVYLTVAGLLLVRMAAAGLALRGIVRRAEPATQRRVLDALEYARRTLGMWGGRMRRQARVRLTGEIDSPAVAGIWRPCILLPRELTERLSDEELYFVFLHECAHLRRGDVLLNCWWAILQTMHWFNPVVWLVSPSIRADRELACDELVLAHTSDGAGYGRALLRILELLGAGRPSPAGVGMIESRKAFAGRIRMIAAYRGTSRWAAVVGAAVFLAAGCAGLTNGQGAASAPAERASTQPAAKAANEAPAPELLDIFQHDGEWIAHLTPEGNGPVVEVRVGGAWEWNGFKAKAITKDAMVITDGKTERTVHVGEALDVTAAPVAAGATSAAALEGAQVGSVQIQTVGGQAVAGADKILPFLRSAPGRPYSLDAVNGDVRTLAAMDRFTTVQARANWAPEKAGGGRAVELVFVVQEQPAADLIRKKSAELQEQMDALTKQLADPKSAPAARKDLAGVIAALAQAQDQLNGQMAQMEKDMAVAMIPPGAIYDGGGPLGGFYFNVPVEAPEWDAQPGASGDPVMYSLMITRNSLEQERAAALAAGAASGPSKMKELDVRIAEVEKQIQDHKQQRAEEAAKAVKAGPGAGSGNEELDKARQDEQALMEQLKDFQSSGVGPANPQLEVVKERLALVQAEIQKMNTQLKSSPPQETARKAYEVRDLIGVPEGDLGALTADERAAAQDLVAALRNFSGSAEISAFNGTLVVRGTDQEQRAIQGVLEELRDQAARRRDKLQEKQKAPGAQGSARPGGQDGAPGASLMEGLDANDL